MDSFEWNKIAGAVLFALLVGFGLRIFSEILFETERPEAPGYVIALATPEGSAGAAAPKPIAVLLASADPKKGENSAKKCGACHDFTEGGPNKVGPNLWGVLNRPIASHEGYEYDDSMKAFAKEAGTWTYDHLNTFLTNPKKTVPGTKMAFPGLPDDAERANVIAYLRTLSDNPPPLPTPEEAAQAAPAGGTEVASTQGGAAPAEAPAASTPPPAAEAPAASAPAAEAPAATAPATAAAPATPPPAVEAPPAPPPAAPATPAPATTGGAPAAQAPSGETAEAPAPEAPAPAQLAEQQTAAAEAPAATAPAAAPAAGDPAKGEAFAKRCSLCHDLSSAAANKVGPHLFGVVGRPVASVPDFSYSPAMKDFSDSGKKVWDPALLSTYLTNPRSVVPGTKMVFPGIKADADRADVIAYLETLK